ALETSNEDYVNKFHDALDHLMAPKLTANAPCKDVIIKGQDVDLNQLPVPIFSERDPAPFITLGLCISRDLKSGGKNTSIYRLQVKGRNQLGIMAQHLVRQLIEAEAMGKGLPIAIAIGT